MWATHCRAGGGAPSRQLPSIPTTGWAGCSRSFVASQHRLRQVPRVTKHMLGSGVKLGHQGRLPAPSGVPLAPDDSGLPHVVL